MNIVQTALQFFLRRLLASDEGQDLVEYSLVFSMIAFGCVFGMGSLATGINMVFSTTAATLTTNIT